MTISNTSVPDSLEDHPILANAYSAYVSRKQVLLESGPRVAACGIYNAGKSSLLNTLAGQFGEGAEAFKTGAARVTSTVSELEVAGVTLVDMPGVDGATDDDETAWQGMLGGDCYLYVHRLMAAEFEQSELEFLGLLKEQVRGLESRLVLVISQIDEVGDPEEAARREAAIRTAFTAAVGFEPRWTFAVSAARYKKGHVEGKAGLINISGIPELKNWVSQLPETSANVDWRTFRADRLRTEKDALTAQILAIADELDLQIQVRTAARQKCLQSFEAAVAALVQNVSGSLKKIDSAE